MIIERRQFFFPLFFILVFLGCSFDYGSGTDERNRPDIIMENLEYVRVRGGDPQVRFRAEYAERWEDMQVMEINEFTFEQFENDGAGTNAVGGAGRARIELGTGDVMLRNNVTIDIESEDIIISTGELTWRDRERTLSGSPAGEVIVERRDGTVFTGTGFSANARNRLWEFSGEVRGTYVESDD